MGFESNVEDNGILCEFVEVGDRREEDVGGGSGGNEFVGMDRGESREERVGIMFYGLDLEFLLVYVLLFYKYMVV